MTDSWVYSVRETKIGWIVESFNNDSDESMPQSFYETKEQAAARLLQLLEIKEPISPQSWPEQVFLG